jgi:hypothetical protein
MNIQEGQRVTFNYAGKTIEGTVIREGRALYVQGASVKVELNALLKTLKEGEEGQKLVGSIVDEILGPSKDKKKLEDLGKDEKAVKNVADVAKQTLNTTGKKDVDFDKPESAAEQVKTVLASKQTEEDSSGTVDVEKVKSELKKQYGEAKSSIMRNLGMTGSIALHESDHIAIVTDRIRQKYGNIDQMWQELDSEEMMPEDAIDELLNAGVTENDAYQFVEEATGIEGLREAFVDEDAEYLDSDGEPIDEEPDYGNGDNDSLGLDSETKEEAVIMAQELLNRGMSEEEVMEFIEQEYETSADEAAEITQVAQVDESEIDDAIENPSEFVDDAKTTEMLDEAQLTSDVNFVTGQDVTAEWEKRFEDAIDEFDEEQPDDELYDYLYNKFEVPEPEAVEILQSANMDIPKAVILLCEHCAKRS